MNGGPSHVDTFDPKPMLDEVPRQAAAARTCRTERKTGAAFALAVQVPEVRPERHRGQRALRARRPRCIDDICVIRSMHADVPNHEPSLMLMNCGEARQARPSVGLVGHSTAWGPRTRTCPASSSCAPAATRSPRSQNWQSAFLPGRLPGDLHRHPAHRHREADREHPQPRASARRPARASSTCCASSTSEHLRAAPARGRARGPHPVVRAGLPDAVRGGRRLRRQPASRQYDPRRCTAPASRPGSS